MMLLSFIIREYGILNRLLWGGQPVHHLRIEDIKSYDTVEVAAIF
jgi:hypothetical protein